MKVQTIRFYSAIFVSAIFVCFQAQAQAQPSEIISEAPIIELLDRMADSPEDHKAIADYYGKLAKKSRDEVKLHKTMQQKYSHVHNKEKGATVGTTALEHCENVIKLQESIAKEYDALEALHLKSYRN